MNDLAANDSIEGVLGFPNDPSRRISLRSVWCEQYFKGHMFYFMTEDRSLADSKIAIINICTTTKKAEGCKSIVMLDLLDYREQTAISVYHDFGSDDMNAIQGIDDNVRILGRDGASISDRYDILTQTHVTVKFLGVYLGEHRILSEPERAKFIRFMQRVIPQFDLSPSKEWGIGCYSYRRRRQEAYLNFLEQARTRYSTKPTG